MNSSTGASRSSSRRGDNNTNNDNVNEHGSNVVVTGGLTSPTIDAGSKNMVTNFTHNDAVEIAPDNVCQQQIGALQANPMTVQRSVRMATTSSTPAPTRRQLMVNGISQKCEESELHAIFAQFGAIEKAIIIRDRSKSRHRGFGFVYFTEPRHAERAQRALHGFDVYESALRVSFAEREMLRNEQESSSADHKN